MRPTWLRPWMMVMALLAAGIFGCSRDPLRPTLDAGQTPSGMGSISVSGDTLIVPPILPGDSTLAGNPRDSLMINVTKPMDGLTDGFMVAGRMRLDIPRAAIRGACVIEMKASRNGKYVHLEILPADYNDFEEPVLLSSDCTGAPESILKNLAFFWIDPVTNDWILVDGSEVNMETGVVSAPLMHFSEYRIGNRLLGKAGW